MRPYLVDNSPFAQSNYLELQKNGKENTPSVMTTIVEDGAGSPPETVTTPATVHGRVTKVEHKEMDARILKMVEIEQYPQRIARA